MHGLTLVLFAIAAGYTISSIVANLYRIIAGTTVLEIGGKWQRAIVMIFAGPNFYLDAAVHSLAAKKWKPPLFWCAIAALAYWSLALGLFVIDIAINLQLVR